MLPCCPIQVTQSYDTYCLQASDAELRLAHSQEHIAYVDGPPEEDEWVYGDNFYSEATPVAARTAAGCTVQVRWRLP